MSSLQPITGYKYLSVDVTNPLDPSEKIKVYGVIVFNDNDEIEPTLLGIYSLEEGSIKMNISDDYPERKKAFNSIINEINDYLESDAYDDSQLIDISYFKDIIDGKVFWKNPKNDELINIGSFEGLYKDEYGVTISDKMIKFM